MANGVLTPLQLIAGYGLIQNQGFAINANLASAINTYNSTSLISTLSQAIVQGSSSLQPATIAAMQSIGRNSVPALSNSVPAPYNFALATNPPGFTGLLVTTSNTYLGNGDLTKFVQYVSIALGYASMTNDYINSAANSDHYLANTFNGMNNLITGDITLNNSASKAYGKDLAALGQLINLGALNDLGSPLALTKQIVKLIGTNPSLTAAFKTAGVPDSVVVSLNNPRYTTTDAIQKLMYQAMTTITGDTLTSMLKFLKVTTPNIQTLADLLNPVKLLPNSFQTLTVPTVNGTTPVYIDTGGSINTQLEKLLPPYIVNSAT